MKRLSQCRRVSFQRRVEAVKTSKPNAKPAGGSPGPVIAAISCEQNGKPAGPGQQRFGALRHFGFLEACDIRRRLGPDALGHGFRDQGFRCCFSEIKSALLLHQSAFHHSM